MRFISMRELRNQSGRIPEAVAEETLTLTVNGKPVALIVGLGEGDDPVELERLIRQVRAQWAVSRIRKRAQRTGADRMSPEEIEEEIRQARAERPSR
jgi:prevent-host-death family protein